VKFRAFLANTGHDIEVRAKGALYIVTIDGMAHEVDAAPVDATFYSLLVQNKSYDVSVDADGRDHFVVRHGGFSRRVKLVNPLTIAAGAHVVAAGPADVRAVMPGRVVKLLVAEGDAVEEGQPIAVLEAMKMENDIVAPKAGRVATIRVGAGQAVEGGEKLLVIE
jgi:biotin carboxyl carrier protein